MKRHSRLAAALIAAALIVPVSGCAAMFTPQATEIKYAGGDGAATALDQVKIRGVMVITKGQGKPGQFLATVFNSSQSPATVTLSTPNFHTTVSVKPNKHVRIGPKDGKKSLIPSVSVKPGSLLDVTAKSGSQTKQFKSQVFNGALPQYRDYLPTKQPSPSATKSSGSKQG